MNQMQLMSFTSRTIWLFAIFLNGFVLQTSAQLKEAVLPFFADTKYLGKVWNATIPDPLPMPVMHDKDQGPAPQPAGYVMGFPIIIGEGNEWQVDILNKMRYWRTTIDFGKEVPVALYFDHFDPGTSGKLFLCADRQNWVGAFTHISTGSSAAFAIAPVSARLLTIHFELPLDEQYFHISLSELGILYKPFNAKGFGTSGPCQVNVGCTEGDLWQKQRRGVVRILVRQGSFLFYCSGSLINNTANDAIPYLLTANHCGENASTNDYAQWIFSFNYEAPNCSNPLVEPVYQSMTGAGLISKAISGTQAGSDFKLLRLLQNVPLQYQPFYNGWSRLNQTSLTGVGIHHPDGDIKKISTYTTPLISSGYGTGGNNPNEKYWRVQWSATANGHGVTEGGSSGSPIFNSQGLIVGMLTGGSSSCSNTLGFDFYGKFSYSWESNGNDAVNQLKPWLDPLNTGQTSLQGLDSDPHFLIANFEAKQNDIVINQFVEFENTSGGYIENYEWHFPGGEPSSSTNEKPGPVLYRQYGDFDVMLIVRNPFRSDTLLRKAYVSVKPFVYPNPAQDVFTVGFGVDLTEELSLKVFDAMGREVKALVSKQGNKLKVAIPQASKGVYLLKVQDRYVDRQLKVLLLR